MTKLAYVSLQSFIKDKVPDVTQCKKATSIALGVTASRLAPLPSSEVDSAEEHFASAAKALITEIIAAFNEEIVVDVDLALETARSYWLIRYYSAYPCCDATLIPAGECEFLIKLTGGTRFLGEETRNWTNENSELAITLVNRMTLVVCPSTQSPAVAEDGAIQPDATIPVV